MRSRRRGLLAAALLLGAGMAVLPTVASSVETTPTISAYNEPGIYGSARHYWQPSTATVGSGGAVKFVNPYTETYHGLKFTGGSAGETPKCTGLPPAAETSLGAFHWEGECTFGKPGTYTFICTVHPTEMTGTVTVPGTPKAKTTSAGPPNQTEATLNGTVEPEGNAIQYHFEYGTGSVSEHTTAAASLGASDFTSHSVSVSLSGLSPEREYHFQLIATYESGKATLLGGEQIFTTPAAAVPTATTTAAAVKGQTEATLNGKVDPNGGNATEYFFEYGTTESYGKKTTTETGLPADNTEHPASATVHELQPGMTYHFRLVAQNAAGGPIDGADATFKTESPPAPKETPPPTTTTTSTTPPPATTTPVLTTPPPKSEEPPMFGPPLAGGPSLRSSQRGSSVRGSVAVSQAGAGGRLEVDLFAPGASLARVHRPAAVRVGRFVRSSVRSGAVPFAVGLSARGRSALRRSHRLALTVRISLTPVSGAPETVTRSVVLRG